MGAKKLGNCVRCFNPTPAITTERLTFGGDTYEWELCDSHADAFRRDIFGWTRCGDLVDDVATTFKTPKDPSRRGRVIAAHVHIPVARPAPAAPPPKPAPVPQPPAQPRLKLMDLPAGYDKWTFSDHAIDRLSLRKIRPEEALWAACQPEVVRAGLAEGTAQHTRGHIRVIVNPTQRVIVTAIDTRVTSQQEREMFINAATA